MPKFNTLLVKPGQLVSIVICRPTLHRHQQLAESLYLGENVFNPCANPEGGGGRVYGPSPENHKNIGFLSSTGPDPLKNQKLPSQHSMLSQHRHASETPFKWRFAGGSMMANLLYYLDPSFSINPHQLNKKLSNLDPCTAFLLCFVANSDFPMIRAR